MPVLIQYVGGYGWHMGRILLLPVLFVSGVALTLLMVAVCQLAGAYLKWPSVYSMGLPFIVPGLFILALQRRLARKLSREPYVVNLPEGLEPDATPWLIPKGHRHFRVLLMLDLLIWGLSIITLLWVAAAPIITVLSR